MTESTESSKVVGRRGILRKTASVLGTTGTVAILGTGIGEADTATRGTDTSEEESGTGEGKSTTTISVRGGYDEGWSAYTIKVDSPVSDSSTKQSTITHDGSGSTRIEGDIQEGNEDYYTFGDDRARVSMIEVHGTVEINKETPNKYYPKEAFTFEGWGFYDLTTSAGKHRCRNSYSNDETKEIDEWSAQCTSAPSTYSTNGPTPLRTEVKEDNHGWDMNTSWCTGHIGKNPDESDRYRLAGNIKEALIAGDMTVRLT
ncbi:hypothetical protein [Halococcus thailandensis]|uniref:hypothetical protein n=1 Tax=Halococcus thailandensis TaxID=335952 RepID=UPI001267B761|nr:hypothetical protein [Halococcus thailandensis]